MTAKLAAMWIAGGLFLLAGTWIVNNLEFAIGVTEYSYAFAMIIALIFFLLTGLFWISTAKNE